MAHGRQKDAGSAVADHVGLFTTLALLGGLVGVVWMCVKSPKVAGSCIFAALIFAGIAPNPATHPLVGLAAIITGFCLVKGK